MQALFTGNLRRRSIIFFGVFYCSRRTCVDTVLDILKRKADEGVEFALCMMACVQFQIFHIIITKKNPQNGHPVPGV